MPNNEETEIIDAPVTGEIVEDEKETQDKKWTIGQWLAALSGDGMPSVSAAVLSSISGPMGIILKYVVIALVMLLLAASSFTFGTEFIGPWLFRSYVGDGVSTFFSGLACLVLFDLAYISSLNSFFNGARSNFQRGLYLLFFVVPFLLGLVASLAGFMLVSDTVMLSTGERQLVGNLGRMAIYAGIVNLALYGIFPNAIDPDNIHQMLWSMIESDRESRKQQAWLLMEQQSSVTYFDTVREAAANLGRAHGEADVEEFKQFWGQRLVNHPALTTNDDNVFIIPAEEPVADPKDKNA